MRSVKYFNYVQCLSITDVDGDTIDVMHNGKAERIRLYGIDCPEKKQPYGKKAKWFTSELTFCKTVTVIVKGRDRYSRTIGEVILPDGKNLNRELVRVGYAWWYRKYAPKDFELMMIQNTSKEFKAGLWADGTAVPPWEFRKGLGNEAIPLILLQAEN